MCRCPARAARSPVRAPAALPRGPARFPRTRAARGAPPPASRRAQRLGAELHVVRAAQLFLGEVDLEDLLEILAIPGEGAQELLVVGPTLVPVGQQRGG